MRPKTHLPACIMLQGTGSNAGKSALTAGLARLFSNQGFKTLPFKPQNMSNNAAVTPDGGEIGRAQAFQAFAAHEPPNRLMNPILLKPEGEGSQLVILGKAVGTIKACDYYKCKTQLLEIVMQSFAELAQQADIILVEGAGSPAEINLRASDIANMGFATVANIPALLVADIDRGGVLASVVGTHHLLNPNERAHLKGYIINKFRGDVTLFTDAIDIIHQESHLDCLGIVPFHPAVKWFADEDSMTLRSRNNIACADPCQPRIIVAHLPHIANADDFTPLAENPEINFRFAPLDAPMPPCDWVILPGSKNTISDLQVLKDSLWHIDIQAHLRHGGKILGICGGYQMLGKKIADPNQIEGSHTEITGLGLLNVETILTAKKILQAVEITYPRSTNSDIHFSGYEIHLGRTYGKDTENGWLKLRNALYGACPAAKTPYAGQVFGCYLHGIFNNSRFCNAFFQLPNHPDFINIDRKADLALDEFATCLEQSLDISKLLAIAKKRIPTLKKQFLLNNF